MCSSRNGILARCWFLDEWRSGHGMQQSCYAGVQCAVCGAVAPHSGLALAVWMPITTAEQKRAGGQRPASGVGW